MDWKPFAAAVVLTLAVCATASAASLDRSASPSKGSVSKDDVRKAIIIFRRDPASVQGEMTRSIILEFAKDSPEVEIGVSEKRMPWIDDGATPSETSLALTVAYMAGDIVAQLDKGNPKDDPVVATERVIATYRQLQKMDSKLKVPAVEKLVGLQRQGKLSEYFKRD